MPAMLAPAGDALSSVRRRVGGVNLTFAQIHAQPDS